MAIDLRQFHQTFFEESFEGLDLMEANLLHLDVGAVDPDTIDTIFRAAHSIKGGSGTFGFNAVASFTHVMETLLDSLRVETSALTREGVDLLLESVDCLREMLTAVRDETAIDQSQVDAMQQRLEQLLETPTSCVSKAVVAGSPNPVLAQPDEWLIHFRPLPHLLRTGNDPVRLLRELEVLGELNISVDSSALPEFSQMDPEICYLSWDLVLRGDINRQQLTEVFAWVEGDCDLDIRSQPVASSSQVARVERSGGDESKKVANRAANVAEAGSIRVSIDKIDALINMVGELVITQSMLNQLGKDFDMQHLYKLHNGLGELERNTRELQESVLRIRMLPISFAFNRFPRLVHDLSQKLGKSVELKMAGEQTELDKTVLEKIVDPLVHLVRNSLDHGIESPQVRRLAGKAETGTIHLSAQHKGGSIVIEISDDGAGLNKHKILKKAQERGLVSESQNLSEAEIYKLIFLPGFSTADVVSDVSGRGVGMDVVSRNIKSLEGSVDIVSKEGLGTTISIRLPLTLAILDGQSARTGVDTYIIPLVSIIESIQVRPGMVKLVAGKGEVLALRNEYLPILRLYEVFRLQPRTTDLCAGLIVVVEGDGQRVGLFVEELLGQQQVVIKSLETNFKKVAGISGATILGDGTVALILDIAGLIAITRKNSRVKPVISDKNAAAAA